MKRILYPTILAGTVLLGGFLAYSIWMAGPRTAHDFYNSGKAYYDQKKYSEAGIQLLNAIRKDPRMRDAYYVLALSYLDQGNGNSAVRQLMALLELYPDDKEANLKLGEIYVGV